MALARAARSPNKAVAADTRAAKRKASHTPPGVLTVPGASAFAPRAAGSPAPTIQAKLEIGSPNDRFEREAERVADQVVGMPHTPTFVAAPLPGHADRSVQRMCDECSEEDKPLLQRMPLPEAPIRPRISALRNGITARPASPSQATVLQRQDVDADETLQAKTATGTAPDVLPDVETGVHALRGRGQPLSSAERAFFEPRFGHDFGQVRIHTDAHAAASARAVKARAFTLGRDVVFGAGQYTPETATGRQVLAHELTHVVQQGLGKSGGVIQRAPSLNGWIFNTVRVSADNCAAAAGYKRLGPDSQFYSSQSLLYPSLHKAVTNGMELKAIVSDHAPGTSYDIKRVAERNSWQRDSAADPWHPVPGQHKPSGTNDDPNDLDECLSPIPQAHLGGASVAIYSLDHPGLNPDTLRATATQGVYKASFVESVEIRDAQGTKTDPTEFDWHCTVRLDKDA